MKKNSKIFIAGHKGMVGSAIHRRLLKAGFENIILADRTMADLRDQHFVDLLFDMKRPEFVFLAAAKVGGIHANNSYPAEFIRDNLMIQSNVIDAAFRTGTRKLLFLGSSCVYPRIANRSIREVDLMTSALEPTNEAYAIAKIAGIKMCQAYAQQYGSNFISLMPTNLYGPNDNYHPENSHVLPALIRKFHYAKTHGLDSVEVWGSGIPRREFLHVDDLADACTFLMENYDSPEIINVGTGVDLSIRELALLIKDCANYDGDLWFNPAYPDGTPQKLLDTTRINSLGWAPRISLRKGIEEVYQEYEQKQLLEIN